MGCLHTNDSSAARPSQPLSDTAGEPGGEDTDKFCGLLRLQARDELCGEKLLYAQGNEVQPIYEVYGKGKSGYTGDDIDVLAFRGRIACD